MEEESVFLGFKSSSYEKSGPTLFPLQIWPGESGHHSSGHTDLFILDQLTHRHFIIENDSLWQKWGKLKQFHVEYMKVLFYEPEWAGCMSRWFTNY